MILLVVIAALALAALLPMVYHQPWNMKVAITLFFFAYPMMMYTGPFGLAIMWAMAAGFALIPKGDQDVDVL